MNEAADVDDEVTPTRDPMIGRLIDGRYRLAVRLGSGGMGVVYSAHHAITGREVAVKLLHPSTSHSAEMLARFAREARTSAAIGHPNIVEVLDAGALPEGTPFLVMELLHGEALGSLLWREKRLSPVRTAEIIGQAARALDALHARGVIHRDVKTDNLFIEHDGRVKLLDFGLAVFTDGPVTRVTQEGVFNGTPQYMPPEVFDGGEPNVAWDVYSLATVAFELLTGVVPFEGENPIVMLYGKRESVAPRLRDVVDGWFSDELERAIRRGLERTPGRRPKTPLAFAEELARAAEVGSRTQVLLGRSTSTAPFALGSPKKRRPVNDWRHRARLPLLAIASGGAVLATWLAVARSEPTTSAPPAPSTIPTAEPRAQVEATPALDPIGPSTLDVETWQTNEVATRERPRARAARASRHEEADAGFALAAAPAVDRSNARELVRDGTAALMRGRIPDAVDMLHRATALAPESSTAWRNLGLANERMGRTVEARHAYDRYLTLAPTAPDAPEVRRRIAAL